jgi:hypothetical protein
MNKSPFIESYLKEFSDGDVIEQVIKDNKCKTIAYSKVLEDTNLKEYDYIIIVGKSELKRIVQNDKGLYENYKNKLFFVGNYCNSYDNYDDYKNILHEIHCGLNVNIFKEYKKKIIFSNMTQNISFNPTEYSLNHNYDQEDTYYEYNGQKRSCFYDKILPSSIKQIDIKICHQFEVFKHNLPNKIICINYNNDCDLILIHPNKIKLPKNIILITTGNIRYEHNLMKQVLNMKIKMIIIKIRTNNNNTSDKKIIREMIIRKKNNCKLQLLSNLYTRCWDFEFKNMIHFCKTTIFKENICDSSWKIISRNYIKMDDSDYNDAEPLGHIISSCGKYIPMNCHVDDNIDHALAHFSRFFDY